jgi:hypothetical protein
MTARARAVARSSRGGLPEVRRPTTVFEKTRRQSRCLGNSPHKQACGKETAGGSAGPSSRSTSAGPALVETSGHKTLAPCCPEAEAG